jgi:hypothetical protein
MKIVKNTIISVSEVMVLHKNVLMRVLFLDVIRLHGILIMIIVSVKTILRITDALNSEIILITNIGNVKQKHTLNKKP